jgi:hypothetical protein
MLVNVTTSALSLWLSVNAVLQFAGLGNVILLG